MVVMLLAGVSGLIIFSVSIDALYVHNSRMEFIGACKKNTALLEQIKLPRTVGFARQFREVTGVSIYFRDAAGEYTPRPGQPLRQLLADGALPDSGYFRRDDREGFVSNAGLEKRELFFLRRAPDFWRGMLHPATIASGGIFLVVMLVATGVLARQLVLPLRSMSRTVLEELFDPEQACVLTAVKREDEIGRLAKALQKTRDCWLEERTARKQAEKMAALTHITASFAHEIKNPLTGIKLQQQILLLRQEGMPEREKTAIRLIGQDAQTIERLINQWMYLVHPGGHVRTIVSCAELLKSAARSLQAQMDHAGVTLVLKGALDQRVEVDRLRFGTLLINIFKNGIQAMPEGGRLTANVRPDGEGRVRLCIEDDGAGFSAEALQRAGELFFTEREGGMGLGLSACREIAEAHGGSLRVSNGKQGGRVDVWIWKGDLE